MTQSNRPTGMTGFSIVWIGQIISVLASSMTAFGLTIMMYQKTGSVMAMGGMQVAFMLPLLLVSFFAGPMVDRYNRKLMMMVSDLAAGTGTVIILVLLALGKLEFWHLYIANVLNGIGNAFQWPAYSAAISTMVPKEQYGRANGMMSLIESGPGIVAPLLAGALLVMPGVGLIGIMQIDVATFVFAIGTLLVVHIPQPARTQEGSQGQGNIFKEAIYGFQYIFARPSLLGLQMIFFFGNLVANIGGTVFAPMVLARTAQNTVTLGLIESVGGVAAVIGGVAMSVWGGFRRKVHGVLLGWFFGCLFGMTLFGLGRDLPIWLVAMVISSLFTPMINGSNQAIWQAKVAPDVQGRVFSARRLIAWFTSPISPLIAGVLADTVLEPAMRTQSPLANMFGGLVGTGPGAGMGLLLVFCGIGGGLVGLSGYFFPAIRNAETLLPDHDALPLAGSQTVVE